MTQKDFERLSELMAQKGVKHEAFELLADLRQSERLAKEEVQSIKNSVIDALKGFVDFEGFAPSEINYLQVIRKMKSQLTWRPASEKPEKEKEDVMEKTEMMKKFEAETGETLDMSILSGDATGSWYGFLDSIEAKAAAYDRLMSGGKKTLKEIANFLGRAVAVDDIGNAESFAGEPRIDIRYGFWYLDEDDEDYEDDRFLIPRDIVDFNGDWKDSLTLPDGWEEAQFVELEND